MPPQRRYICSFCARAFSRSEHRARHERSHTKEKPFGCDKCDSAFVRRDLLQRHLRTVHAKDKKTDGQLIVPDQMTSSSSTSSSPRSSVSSPRPSFTVADHSQLSTASIVTVDKSELYKFNEKNVISLLTLSQRFNKLDADLSLKSKISSFFLVWGTMSNLQLPVMKTNQMLELDEKSSLFYALLSCGAADSNQFDDCLKLLNKAWVLILKSSNDSREIVQSLTIISHIYLQNYQTLKRLNVDSKHELVPIEIIMDYLDQTTMKLLEQQHEPLFNYWYIYLILSNFALTYNKKPPAVHQLFLSKALPSNDMTLLDLLETLARSPTLPVDDEVSSHCLIMGLSNELQALKHGQTCSFQCKGFLHNAIIMANKTFIQHHTQSTTEQDDSDVLNNLIMISKRNLLLNCPVKFQDLIADYIMVPKTRHHWSLLNITLKEFNFEYNARNLQQFSQAGSPDDVSLACLNYLNSLNIHSINNNLGLISLPLLFIGFLSNSSLTSDFNSVLNLPSNFTLSIIENYMGLIKIFITLNSNPDFLNNPILQSIIYVVSEMGYTTSSELQMEISSVLQSCSTAQVSQGFINYFAENIHQNLISWIISSYIGVNKPEVIQGFNMMMDNLPISVSPIQSGASSPMKRYIYPSTSQPSLQLSPPVQVQSLSSIQQTSSIRQSLEHKITLPPINLSLNDQRDRVMLPVPYNVQGYRYGY